MYLKWRVSRIYTYGRFLSADRALSSALCGGGPDLLPFNCEEEMQAIDRPSRRFINASTVVFKFAFFSSTSYIIYMKYISNIYVALWSESYFGPVEAVDQSQGVVKDLLTASHNVDRANANNLLICQAHSAEKVLCIKWFNFRLCV